MEMSEARREHHKQTLLLRHWQMELWRTNGEYMGEDWSEIARRVEALQRELESLRAILETSIPSTAQVVYGD